MTIETFPFDPTDYLRTREALDEYLLAVGEDGTPEELTDAEAVVAQARLRWGIADA